MDISDDNGYLVNVESLKSVNSNDVGQTHDYQYYHDNIMINNIMIVVGEKNLCKLIEYINSDKITRQLKVAKICSKSIPENICRDFYDEITFL